jgi:hypothetical protein
MTAAPPRRSPLLLWLSAATLAACALMAAQLTYARQGLLNLPLYDYVAFWAADRLNTVGKDPFDPALLEAVEREANPATVDVLVMWSTPWGLTLVAPFTRLGPQTGHVLWQLAQLGTLLLAVEILWRLRGGTAETRWQVWLLTFTYLPCYFLLVTGQFGAIMLLGFAGFLYFLKRQMEIAAGACLALASMKPQLTFLFWIALLLWALDGRRWRVAVGGILAVAALLTLPIYENPHLPWQYWVSLTQRTQTYSHLSPVAGTALRFLLAPGRMWPQFIPLVPGLLWLAWYWRRHRHAWDWNERLPALLFASFLAAPYGAWPFDLVVLLLPLIFRARELEALPPRQRATIVIAYAAVGSIALCQILREVEYFWFVWMTPALLTIYLFTGWLLARGHISVSNSSIWRTRSAGGAVS